MARAQPLGRAHRFGVAVWQARYVSLLVVSLNACAESDSTTNDGGVSRADSNIGADSAASLDASSGPAESGASRPIDSAQAPSPGELDAASGAQVEAAAGEGTSEGGSADTGAGNMDAADADSGGRGCEFEVTWSELQQSSPTCQSLSDAHELATATWDGQKLYFGASATWAKHGGGAARRQVCLYDNETEDEKDDKYWRFFEQLALDSGLQRSGCPEGPLRLDYKYQDCLFLPSGACLLVNTGCEISATVTLTPRRETQATPELVAHKTCRPTSLPSRVGADCTNNTACPADAHCDIVSDDGMSCNTIGTCRASPALEDCAAAGTVASCDCDGQPSPPSIFNPCAARATGWPALTCAN